MSRHATAELLSAYLDHELEEPLRVDLADHLEGCEDCRRHLASLRRVVTSLKRLERMAPPPVMAQDVQRRLSISGPPRSPMEWLEERLGRIHTASSISFTFALITALAVVVYFFAHGVERVGRPRTALVLAPAPSIPLPTGEVRETRQAAGRTFDLIDRIWRERGITQPFADFHVDADSEAGRSILSLFPDLAGLGSRIYLRLDGQVVELRGAEPRALQPQEGRPQEGRPQEGEGGSQAGER